MSWVADVDDTRTGVQTEERESDDPFVDEDRVFFAAPDELRERERDGGRTYDAHRGTSSLVIGGVFVPKGANHVHENARALAFDRRRVGALAERKDLVQPRRLRVSAGSRQRQFVAVLGWGRFSVFFLEGEGTELTIAAAQMFHDSDSVDLHHFCEVRARLENVRVDQSLDNASVGERGASGCRVCEMFEQTDEAVLDFDVGLGS